ncbi:hypothetical protein LRP67_20805 [Nocardioides sp. cx-169]|uniref:hypothetical protein n=1 Tax=Nocardioides sp. cx-169 TaxID=2899080 RepID=UPI001E40BD68|nr:hypothetical protein [Nocardioides sp. cx-169]MCD4536538.1 hypothetical protein [Nocardioides sp. cx-169]
MNEIEILQVDERDGSWEQDRPRFRVYLHGSGETETHGWTDTYDITGADVVQVIDWAQRQAGDKLTYAVALVVDDGEQERLNPGTARGLVWLLGADGNDAAHTASDVAVQRRMLERRREPIVVPVSSRMPAGVVEPYAGGGSAT